MKDLSTYIIFDGNAREAMSFYAECFGTKLQMFTFGESPGPCSDSQKNKIMHASLVAGSSVLMASDTGPGAPKLVAGNNFSVSINCESIPETEKFFNSLSKNGTIMMPLQETFWAERFAMFTDQFGINWMLNLQKPH